MNYGQAHTGAAQRQVLAGCRYRMMAVMLNELCCECVVDSSNRGESAIFEMQLGTVWLALGQPYWKLSVAKMPSPNREVKMEMASHTVLISTAVATDTIRLSEVLI